MAGHSKFKNIQHRKGAQDAKRAKAFAKLAKEITVAAKEGLPDPAMNPRLRTAIAAAKSQNLPKDRIERAIQQGSPGGDGADYEQIRYEGYGPGGVALIVEALTDNRNRTAAEVRSAFSKHGGTLGETGSVAFMFDQKGVIAYPMEGRDFDSVFEAAVEAGAEDVETGEEEFEVLTSVEDFAAVRDALEESLGEASSAGLVWRPQNTVAPSEDQAATLLKLLDALDDSDDVQTVHANYDIDDATLEKLAG